MPIERYKSKVIMEHGEEVVQEWIDSMCQQKRWRPKSEQAEQAVTESTEEGDSDQPEVEQTEQTQEEQPAIDL